MKMLLVCPKFHDIEYGILNSFKRLGMDVYPLFFDMGISEKKYIKRIKLKVGWNTNKILREEKKQFNSLALKMYNEIQPDIVYVIQGRWMSKDTLAIIKKKSYIALYLWDMISLFPEMRETFDKYDIIYSFDKRDTKFLKEQGLNAKFKPSGYDNSIYYPIECIKKYDVAFVGAMYPERVKMLKALIKEFPDINWAIYGEYAPLRNWIKWVKWRFSSDFRYFKNSNLKKNDVNKLYNKSKIVLSIVRENQKDGWSARLPEVLGAKTFQLTNYYDSVEKEFIGCLDMYKDQKELIEKIRFYLKNDQKRNIIASEGYRKVKEKYSDDILNKIIIDDFKNNRIKLENKIES